MRPIVVTMGVFDGVHRGHAHILQRIVRRARRLHGLSLAYTFEPHPARVIVPDACPAQIMTIRQRCEAIRKHGLQKIMVQRFTPAFSHLSPEVFFKRVLLNKLRAREVWVGYDFTFGYHRGGTTEILKSLGKKAGIRVTVVEPFLWKKSLVSSTRIRELLSQGSLKKATDLLGHPYEMTGRIVRGRGRGSAVLGIPTANLRTKNEKLLPNGVYVTHLVWKGKKYRGVTNIGINPTFGTSPLSIETHLPGFQGSLRGQRVTLQFLERIREERRFSSPKELALQIQKDIYLAGRFR